MIIDQLILQASNNAANDGWIKMWPVGSMIYTFGVILIVCEMCQAGCDAVNATDMEISQIDWHLYPIEIKKVLPMIIIQKPVSLKAFGSMATDRKLFRKVLQVKKKPEEILQ